MKYLEVYELYSGKQNMMDGRTVDRWKTEPVAVSSAKLYLAGGQ